ncbi:MAG: hypothetical protein WCB85_12465 [Candidatus Dormiibacterota bacterium]
MAEGGFPSGAEQPAAGRPTRDTDPELPGWSGRGAYAAPGYPQISPFTHRPTSNGPAMAALVVGIIAVLACWVVIFDLILATPAVVLGAVGISRAKQLGGMGRGMAIAGTALGAGAGIATVVLFLFVVATHCAGNC